MPKNLTKRCFERMGWLTIDQQGARMSFNQLIYIMNESTQD